MPTGSPSLSLTLVLLLLLCAPADASTKLTQSMACAIDDKTHAAQCFRLDELTEVGGYRMASLFTGGVSRQKRTNFFAVAECDTKILHIKDGDAVSIARGPFSKTRVGAELGDLLCRLPAASKAKKK